VERVGQVGNLSEVLGFSRCSRFQQVANLFHPPPVLTGHEPPRSANSDRLPTCPTQCRIRFNNTGLHTARAASARPP
jgi:hypothetical protein